MLPRLSANGNNVYAFTKTAENYYFPYASLRIAEISTARRLKKPLTPMSFTLS